VPRLSQPWPAKSSNRMAFTFLHCKRIEKGQYEKGWVR
jgi:hypothetical protein